MADTADNGPWADIRDAPADIYLIGRERTVVFFRDETGIYYIDRAPTSPEFANEHGPFIRWQGWDHED